MSAPRIIATVEARMTSSRLPGKVLMPAGREPLLEILLARLAQVKRLDAIMVATTVNATDDPIVALCQKLGVPVFRGSEDDVLGRVCGALRSAGADICVEITADCPLIDPVIVGEAIDAFLETRGSYAYVSNSDPHRAVPAGLDVQVFEAQALYQVEQETRDPQDREHVSLAFYRPESGDRWHPRFIKHASSEGASDILVTLDYAEDYDLIRSLHEEVSKTTPSYRAPDIIAWVRDHNALHDRCIAVRGQEPA